VYGGVAGRYSAPRSTEDRGGIYADDAAEMTRSNPRGSGNLSDRRSAVGHARLRVTGQALHAEEGCGFTNEQAGGELPAEIAS
jgi:hypothetical protein